MDKGQLRKLMLAKRAAITEKEQRSELICKKLTALPEFKEAKRVAFYISTKDEVHTHDLIKQLLRKKEKTVAVPVYSSGCLSVIKRWNELSKGSFGVLEPREDTTIAAVADVDVIIVPGLAFDITHNRLGHGKGFYDQLLKHFKWNSVALAYDDQIVETIPVEKHDIPVNKIITEKRII